MPLAVWRPILRVPTSGAGTMTTTVSDRSTDPTATLLDQVERLRPLIQEHAADAEASRHLSSLVYDAMFEAGLSAMQAPRAYGGLELHPVETMRVLESVARIDPAAAWNLSMNQAI